MVLQIRNYVEKSASMLTGVVIPTEFTEDKSVRNDVFSALSSFAGDENVRVYANGTIEVQDTSTYGEWTEIEAGDMVVKNDDGEIQIIDSSDVDDYMEISAPVKS